MGREGLEPAILRLRAACCVFGETRPSGLERGKGGLNRTAGAPRLAAVRYLTLTPC